jgi:hypothetical protein
MLKHTLGSIVVLLSPLSTSSLSRLLHLLREDVDQTFEDLYAILDIPDDATRALRLHHPSFRDFLLNKDRCGNFWVAAHQVLAAGCIQLMSHTLKKDICEMHAPGSQASQVESSWIEKCLPPEVQYACLYWVQHLQRGGSHINHITKVEFLLAFKAAYLESMTTNNAKAGIRGAGLIPFDPQAVISKLDIKLRTPTPTRSPPLKCLTTQPTLFHRQLLLRIGLHAIKKALQHRFFKQSLRWRKIQRY